jgi:nucleoid DNA-binding protein
MSRPTIPKALAEAIKDHLGEYDVEDIQKIGAALFDVIFDKLKPGKDIILTNCIKFHIAAMKARIYSNPKNDTKTTKDAHYALRVSVMTATKKRFEDMSMDESDDDKAAKAKKTSSVSSKSSSDDEEDAAPVSKAKAKANKRKPAAAKKPSKATSDEETEDESVPVPVPTTKGKAAPPKSKAAGNGKGKGKAKAVSEIEELVEEKYANVDSADESD